jgi:hypothetical protein
MTRCKGCGAEVLWRKTPAGRYIALDPGPELFLRLIPTAEATDEERAAPRRTIVQPDVRVVVGHEVPSTSTRGAPVRGRIAHWATCPQANAFRRKETSPDAQTPQ